MLETFPLGQLQVDSLDLKVMLLSAGVVLPQSVYEHYASSYRIMDPSNLMACNGLILPGNVAAHLTPNDESPFSLEIGANGSPCLLYEGVLVTEVALPPHTAFYQQKTSQGKPFFLYAVLEGRGILAFHYLWHCQFARQGEPCEFCFQALADVAGLDLPSPSAEEVGEIIAWCLQDGCVQDVQLTGGSRFSERGECPQMAAILRGIDAAVGLEKIPGEVYAYLSSPAVPEAVDEVFEAGIDRVSFDLNLWDVDLHEQVCPGHAHHIGRERQLRVLEYVAQKYGPNKACSSFVVGLEPEKSLLEGAEYLASRGIVPLMSAWMPGIDPILGKTRPPGIDYYRRVREGFAKLYQRYQLVPPGIKAGAHVSMCHDVYEHLDDLLPA